MIGNRLVTQIQLLISNIPELTFKPLSTLKTLIINGHKYSQNTVLNVLKENFPTVPIIGKIRWIRYDGKTCAFVCKMYKVKCYVQQLRAFQVEEINKFGSFLFENICYKKPLKLVAFHTFLYLPLHPYGKSFTVL
ncbi:unnamed protein product [Rotaria socialis]|uniref:Uncharacterized protein n=1 Tax=Rotaria socialis TaxID=392032 RepID=A0A821RL28_9BILA|nr:unnamed protein product [Rotaria socialis]CAF3337878.1 unnamed protein product [Rotaria socialis]CAF3347112.1 unnamed protein product [Rotaria socialis]CAF3475742.1 unnamed protein product [Rotaria socialis]CAF4529197.1 unnamed protein product [Rotaria socialis]